MCCAHFDGWDVGQDRTRTARADSELRSFPSTTLRLAPTLRLEICGVNVDHLLDHQLVERVERQFTEPRRAPLAVGSINLDHIHHFGSRRPSAARRSARRWQRTSAPRPARKPELGGDVEWLMLIDGAPVARRASAVTGLHWPRLAGADLLPDLLTVAERMGARVGFLGGHEDTTEALWATLDERWPQLEVAGFWTPPRSTVESPAASAELAAAIAASRVDMLVVGLGKPRQERWIETYGLRTEAQVMLAFGASADFLAGSARRAPAWMRRAGIEWLFRLAQEPRRLARRYLVQGPAALRTLRHARASITYRETPWPTAGRSRLTRGSERRVLAP